MFRNLILFTTRVSLGMKWWIGNDANWKYSLNLKFTRNNKNSAFNFHEILKSRRTEWTNQVTSESRLNFNGCPPLHWHRSNVPPSLLWSSDLPWASAAGEPHDLGSSLGGGESCLGDRGCGRCDGYGVLVGVQATVGSCNIREDEAVLVGSN